MANKRIVEDGKGTRFSSERQPENAGRKPKVFTILKKRYGINLASNGTFTQGQIIDLLQSLLSVDIRQTTAVNLLINREMKRIAEQVRNGQMPDNMPKNDEVISQVFVALTQAINKETANGKSDTIRWIIEYLFGKAIQTIEGDISTTIKQNEALTTEEIEAEIERIQQSRHDR